MDIIGRLIDVKILDDVLAGMGVKGSQSFQWAEYHRALRKELGMDGEGSNAEKERVKRHLVKHGFFCRSGRAQGMYKRT